VQLEQIMLQSGPVKPGSQAQMQVVPQPRIRPVEEHAPPGTLAAVHAYV